MRQVARLRPNQCPACHVTFQPDTDVIRTSAGTVLCAAHVDMVTTGQIAATGTWREVRRLRPTV